MVALSKRDTENVQSFSAFLTQSVRTASLSEQIATRNSRLMVVAASCVFVDDFRNDFNVGFSSFFFILHPPVSDFYISFTGKIDNNYIFIHRIIMTTFMYSWKQYAFSIGYGLWISKLSICLISLV